VLSFDVEGDNGTSLEKWVPPTSTPPETRSFRKNFAAQVESPPECDSDDDSDDDDLLTVAAAAEASKPFLDLSYRASECNKQQHTPCLLHACICTGLHPKLDIKKHGNGIHPPICFLFKCVS
jgi:hypothetical protein